MSNNSRVVIVQQDSNGLGLAGLIFSCIGWVTCGLLCIPGAFLSFLGLFSKGPKGTSIAGLIVGFPGVLFFVFFGFTMLAGIVGIGSVAAVGGAAVLSEAGKPIPKLDTPSDMIAAIDTAGVAEDSDLKPEKVEIAEEIKLDLPNTPESSPLPEPDKPSPVDSSDQLKKKSELSLIPKKKSEIAIGFREFSDVSGQFRVNAQYLGIDEGKVKLKKTDGTEIEVPLERLSEGDIAWISLQGNK